MNTIVQDILGFPKTLYVNLRSLPLRQALKLPIVVSHRTKFKSLRGRFEFMAPLHRGMLRIGYDGSGTSLFTPTVIENDGVIVCGDNVSIGGGCQICTVANGTLRIGRDSCIMGDAHICARNEVTLGAGSFISWDTQIMDTDFHDLLDSDGTVLNPDKPVVLGRQVWVGSRASILKGVHIPDGCIVASGSTLAGNHAIPDHAVIAGLPIRVLRRNVRWR